MFQQLNWRITNLKCSMLFYEGDGANKLLHLNIVYELHSQYWIQNWRTLMLGHNWENGADRFVGRWTDIKIHNTSWPGCRRLFNRNVLGGRDINGLISGITNRGMFQTVAQGCWLQNLNLLSSQWCAQDRFPGSQWSAAQCTAQHSWPAATEGRNPVLSAAARHNLDTAPVTTVARQAAPSSFWDNLHSITLSIMGF